MFARGDLAAARRANARLGMGKRLIGHRHVMGICVQQHLFIGHDPDMALPKHQIPAAQRCILGQKRAERCLLLVTVPWAVLTTGA